MKQTYMWVLAGCLAGLAPMGTVYAHHAASAQYDVEKIIQFKGVLTKVEWVNPHAHMTFDVKGNDGKISPWSIEFFGVTGLRKMGLANKNVMTIGNTYALTVSPSRDGSNTGLIQSLTFPDGRVYSTASVPPALR